MEARNSIVTIHRSHLQGWGKPIPESQCCLWGAGPKAAPCSPSREGYWVVLLGGPKPLWAQPPPWLMPWGWAQEKQLDIFYHFLKASQHQAPVGDGHRE